MGNKQNSNQIGNENLECAICVDVRSDENPLAIRINVIFAFEYKITFQYIFSKNLKRGETIEHESKYLHFSGHSHKSVDSGHESPLIVSFSVSLSKENLNIQTFKYEFS